MHLKDLLRGEMVDFQQERVRLQTIFENTPFKIYGEFSYGKYKKDFLGTLLDKDLEVLYDDAYCTALLLIELSTQAESHNRIGRVRQLSKGAK